MGRIVIGRVSDGSYLVDLRGWMCPYPKYMLEPLLGRIDAPSRVVFLVDCPSAVSDLPKMALRKGCEPGEIKQIADGEWQVTIEVR